MIRYLIIDNPVKKLEVGIRIYALCKASKQCIDRIKGLVLLKEDLMNLL